MSDQAQPEIKIVGYCRVCGTGLDEANVRTSNGTIYCAEHVPVSYAGSGNGAPSGQASAAGSGPGASSTPPGGSYQQTYHSSYAHSPYTAPSAGAMGNNSPGAAFLLGMIPGVGAIYNGQYVKGAVHIIILAILIAAADESTGAAGPLAGFLIVGFWFYMAFEAYHTARRLKDGLPVDEFSGLSDRQSVRFPVMAVLLIFFGSILLIDNLGLFDLRRLLKFWPAGLIALGLYMLYARTQDGSK